MKGREKRRLTGRQITAILAMDVFVLIAVFAYLRYERERPFDPSFDTSVAVPAYSGNGPVVLYDEGHHNPHTTKGGYRPFAELVRNDGYELRVNRDLFTPGELEGVDVLVVVLAQGANDSNDDPAFTSEEIDLVDGWVRGGGSLLLITDHWPYGAANAPLAERLGVRIGNGLVEDPQHSEPGRGESHIVFSEENGLLRDHPIVRGRTSGERVRRVLTFTGQSLVGPLASVPFLALSDRATERPSTTPQVDKSGGNVRVTMEYGDPISLSGAAQGLAFEHGAGRVVVLGEAGMLRAEKSDDLLVGMNVPGFDNRQLALNIMHWVSRL
jgi:hypothetical protein